jgi:hypothetical protein
MIFSMCGVASCFLQPVDHSLLRHVAATLVPDREVANEVAGSYSDSQ